MKGLKKIIAFAVIAAASLSLAAFAACGGGSDDNPSTTPDDPAIVDPGDDTNGDNTTGDNTSSGNTSGEDDTDVIDSTKEVKSIKITTYPTKTTYEVGDTFSLEGGVITVTYKDGTTQELPMTSSSVTYTEPGMDSTGNRTVTLTVGGKTARLSITIVSKSYTITYHYNYEGAADSTVSCLSGDTISDPEATRSGYTLYGWYTDADYTAKYDFTGATASSDLDLYALWLSGDGTDCVTVTFDYDYYGAALASYSYPVDSGSAVSQPSDPARTGYSFSKWVDADGNEYDFSTTLTADTTIKATWTKTAGTETYVFEAEDTNLEGQSSPGLSGTIVAHDMALSYDDASGGKAIAYMFNTGMYLNFYIASDEAVEDAKIEISLALNSDIIGSLPSYTFTQSNFQILVNGDSQTYSATVNSTAFNWYTISTNVSLKAGQNLIKVVVANEDNISGTTLKAIAPCVDAIRITTSAVLIWDANEGLPYTN